MSEEKKDTREAYTTPDHFAETRFEEKKSVFYGWAAPITSEQEAADLIDQAHKTYPDAKHHVYAWILGGKVMQNKYSDDGEPSGTAGIPVLDVLRKNRIEDGIIIVTRYFGGILLGGGGLVRAYTASAALALKESTPVKMQRCCTFEVIATYSDFEKIKRTLPDSDFTLDVKNYSAEVLAAAACPEHKKDALLRYLADTSNGRASVKYLGSSFYKSGSVIVPL